MSKQWFWVPNWWKEVTTPGSIPALDGVRATAILLVLYGHLSASFFDENGIGVSIAHFAAHGGVELFFVLSGFLISYPFWQTLLGMAPPVSYRSYSIRRILRIYPLYLAYMAVMFIYFGIYHIPWSELWYYVLFYLYPIQNFVSYINVVSPHTWSIAVEEHFYLLLALYFFSFRRVSPRSHLIALGIVFALSFCYRILALSWIADGADAREVLYANTFAKLDIFVLGMLLAYYDVSRTKYIPRQYGRYALLMCFLLIAMLLVIQASITNSTVMFSIAGVLLNTGTALAWACLIFAVLSGYGVWLGSPILVCIGKISFSLYLLHPVLHNVLYKRLLAILGFQPSVWSTIVFLPVLFAAGLASFLFIEKPFLDKKHLWAPYNETKP